MSRPDRCHRCDRAECQRERASRDYWRARSVISYRGETVDGRTVEELARISAAAHTDCNDHRVDWRARTLAAEPPPEVMAAAERLLALAEGTVHGPWVTRANAVYVAGEDGNPAPRTGMRPSGDTFPRVVGGADYGDTLDFIAACRTLAPLLAEWVRGRR